MSAVYFVVFASDVLLIIFFTMSHWVGRCRLTLSNPR